MALIILSLARTHRKTSIAKSSLESRHRAQETWSNNIDVGFEANSSSGSSELMPYVLQVVRCAVKQYVHKIIVRTVIILCI